MKRSELLAEQYTAKSAEFSTLMAKENISDAEAADARALMGEVKELKGKYTEAVELEREAEETAQFANGLKSNPVNLRHDSQGKVGEASLEGFQPAGTTVVDRKNLAVVYEEGELGLDQKTLSAISTMDYKRSFRNYLRKGINGVSSNELKTLQEGVDAQGGFLVPDDVMAKIIQRKPTPTRLASRVMSLQTSRDRLLIPKVNYTSDNIYTTGIRVTFTGEVPASSTAHRVTDPVFGQIGIPVHTAMLSMPLTNDMVEDSAFPIVSWSADKFQETIELLKDNMIVNGSGLGQPMGILANPGGADQPDIVVTGSAAALTADGLIDLSYSLPEQYDENAAFYLNKTNAGKAIAKLKDSNNRYLFGTGLQDSGIASARPKELLGYDYAFSAFMPDIAANAYPVIFGDLSGYYLVNRIGFSIQVLREVGAEQNEIRLLGRIRLGGQVAEEFKLKIQKCST
jgi:HK97 family phage major capsid protein